MLIFGQRNNVAVGNRSWSEASVVCTSIGGILDLQRHGMALAGYYIVDMAS